MRWGALALIVQSGAPIMGPPRGRAAAAKRLLLCDLGAKISALREGAMGQPRASIMRWGCRMN